MKSIVIENILSCIVLKFSNDFRAFKWSFVVKNKIKTQISWFYVIFRVV